MERLDKVHKKWLLEETSLAIEFLPREEWLGSANVFQRTKYYHSQSARIFQADFFEPNHPTVSVPGQTTTNPSANQMIQFAPAGGLEMTLASYGLLEGLPVKYRGVSGLSLRGLPTRSFFASAVGSTVVIAWPLNRDIQCQP